MSACFAADKSEPIVRSYMQRNSIDETDDGRKMGEYVGAAERGNQFHH